MSAGKESLLIFEHELELIEQELKHHVIRTANSKQSPQNPLRPGKEISYDPTGKFVLANSKTGISLAASLKQLERIIRPGIKKWLLAVDRNSVMPDGFKMQQDNGHHWSIVVTRKMSVDEYERKVQDIIKNWRVMGRFVRYE
ncbi:hypothetical protein MSP8886_01474 [Marinomonas spartinae]|uniref:Uncharacterized protein n=1 Tax=Marinomonas spartinae TaxID=1792290 RepID=A0A1A8TC53_9GAMM|nr:hypothetical protein [Marinomonas spartinae]SBS29204.1 hypothetical protein MSP8886_01474 [Marinomonas spartinae]